MVVLYGKHLDSKQKSISCDQELWGPLEFALAINQFLVAYRQVKKSSEVNSEEGHNV